VRPAFSEIAGTVSFWCFSSVFASVLMSSCHEPARCRNVITSEEISPDGQLKAIVFRRICPEEHSIATHVSILAAKEGLPDSNGNVFADGNEIAVRVAWLSESRLAVYTYADLAKATKIERAGKVTVEYSTAVETALIPPIPDSSPSSTGTPPGQP
jgi:hypothetical protein